MWRVKRKKRIVSLVHLVCLVDLVHFVDLVCLVRRYLMRPEILMRPANNAHASVHSPTSLSERTRWAHLDVY